MHHGVNTSLPCCSDLDLLNLVKHDNLKNILVNSSKLECGYIWVSLLFCGPGIPLEDQWWPSNVQNWGVSNLNLVLSQKSDHPVADTQMSVYS